MLLTAIHRLRMVLKKKQQMRNGKSFILVLEFRPELLCWPCWWPKRCPITTYFINGIGYFRFVFCGRCLMFLGLILYATAGLRLGCRGFVHYFVMSPPHFIPPSTLASPISDIHLLTHLELSAACTHVASRRSVLIRSGRAQVYLVWVLGKWIHRNRQTIWAYSCICENSLFPYCLVCHWFLLASYSTVRSTLYRYSTRYDKIYTV